MALMITLNGAGRTFEELESPVGLVVVIEALALKADRIAIELNGELARRNGWPEVSVASGDRLEIVHFVGGGCGGDY